MKSLQVMKHGCTTRNLRENTEQSLGAPRRKPTANRQKKKKKSISEEGTVHIILQLKLNRAAKTS